MVPLTEACEFVVDYFFEDEPEQVEAKLLLVRECADNLPLYQASSPSGYDRIRFAVIKLSAGDLIRLGTMIELAKIDWRDVLCAADFAHDIKAHEYWLKSLRDST
jgi:hypothetical protein